MRELLFFVYQFKSAKSNLMVNFVSLSLLFDKNKSDGRYSVILCCPLVSFYLSFISKASFPRNNKKVNRTAPVKV